MNYGQVRDQVLKLLNQYTMAGQPVAGSYNDQQDCLNRIPALVNDAMVEIATTARKIPALLRLSEMHSAEYGDQVCYELPKDFYQLVSGSVVTTREGAVLHTNCLRTHGQKTLMVPKSEAGDYTLTYYRYPSLLGEEPADTDELDNEPETHYAIPFYVATYLVDHEDAFLCSLFSSKYADKLAKMTQGVYMEPGRVSDAYRFFE